MFCVTVLLATLGVELDDEDDDELDEDELDDEDVEGLGDVSAEAACESGEIMIVSCR